MRLIDADKLLTKEHQYYNYLADEWFVPVRDIEEAPTIEGRKKGKWIKKVLNYGDRGLKEIRYECPECEMDFNFKWNYCPFCGAAMEGVKDDE